MKIKRIGYTSFHISTDTLDIVTDPIAVENAGLKFPKMEADLVLFTEPEVENHEIPLAESKVEKVVAPEGGEIFELSSAGEFEISEVLIQRPIKHNYFILDHGYTRVVYVGLGAKDLDPSEFENLEDVEALIIPVGDGDLFPSYEKLQEIISNVDPFTLIPCGYKEEKMGSDYASLKGVDEFIKQFGYSGFSEKTTLKLTGKLDSESSMQVVILN